MCTVTVFRLAASGGFRLAFNRDEARTRPAAFPPVEVRAGRVRAVMPVDPTGGGTWVAASDRGLVFALLNYNPRGPAGPPRASLASRGAVIPSLLDCADTAEAAARALQLDATRFGPFRLLVTGGGRHVGCVSDGARVTVLPPAEDDAGNARPLLCTSSGLGDDLVEHPRRALFDRTLAPAAHPDAPDAAAVAAQDDYHGHRWPDRPHLSVCMSRAEARTVSYTTVSVDQGSVVMAYWPAPPDALGRVRPVVRRLALAATPTGGTPARQP